MSDVNELLYTALNDMADCYALQKPVEETSDTFITYNPDLIDPEDFGDDEDLEWVDHMQVHWFSKGRVDYMSAQQELRTRLKSAGFSISQIVVNYDTESGSSVTGTPTSEGYTHIIVYCSIEEE